jgi:hypothetical protein
VSPDSTLDIVYDSVGGEFQVNAFPVGSFVDKSWSFPITQPLCSIDFDHVLKLFKVCDHWFLMEVVESALVLVQDLCQVVLNLELNYNHLMVHSTSTSCISGQASFL